MGSGDLPLGQSWGPLGALLARSGGPERPYPGGTPSLSRPSWAAVGVLFAGGPPGAAPRARTRNIVNQLPEILARLWPVGPANFAVQVDEPRRAPKQFINSRILAQTPGGYLLTISTQIVLRVDHRVPPLQAAPALLRGRAINDGAPIKRDFSGALVHGIRG